MNIDLYFDKIMIELGYVKIIREDTEYWIDKYDNNE